MPNKEKDLYLFEAIELRAEYDARLTSLVELLPENREGDRRRSFEMVPAERLRPVDSLDVAALREEIEVLRSKRRKLNTAVQQANYENTVTVGADEISLAEALELRKEVNKEIGELTAQLQSAAYAKIIYKEERDIVEEPKQDFRAVRQKLEEKRLQFRALNRALQRANHEVTVSFKDEPAA